MAILSEQVKEKLVDLLEGIYRKNLASLVRDPALFRSYARDSLDEQRSCTQLDMAEREIGRPLRDLDCLEVGSGVGMTVAVGHVIYGARVRGIEPGDDEYADSLDVARRRRTKERETTPSSCAAALARPSRIPMPLSTWSSPPMSSSM